MPTPREWEALHRLNQSSELIALRLGLNLEAVEHQLSQAEVRINSRVIADASGKLMTRLLLREGFQRCSLRRLRV